MNAWTHSACILLLPWLSLAAHAEVRVSNGYLTPLTADSAAAYMQLDNQGYGVVRLLGAESPRAGQIRLQTQVQRSGVIEMRPVKKLVVPPGGYAQLQPGDLHLWLTAIVPPLQAGEQLPLTLLFDDGQRVGLTLPVRTAEGQ